MAKSANSPLPKWLTSQKASTALGITARRLRALRDDLKLGQHYRIVSKRSAVRPTYIWNIEAIGQFLGKPLERR